LNNNRGNNRRRGRGNRQGGGGGGQQLNRIDSRARGNAPQLLEKYRKLAHDAHLNGDRVQAEYYLQFADHYFRVIADGRQRQEEQRQRRDDRWEGGPEEADDSSEFSVENDFPSYDQASYARPQREERPRREDRYEREDEAPRNDEADLGGEEEEAQANPYEPPQNPFVRDNRPRGGLRPRRERGPRQEGDEQGGQDEPAGLDPASLPPVISAGRAVADEAEAEAEAKPRRGRPRKKPAGDDAGEALESVN
jgi:hypothetical protein